MLLTGYDSNRSLQTSSKEGIDVSSALKLISHEEGRKISGKAHSVVKDAYFAFLLLRHARIRDLMLKVCVRACVRVCVCVCSLPSNHPCVSYVCTCVLLCSVCTF